MADRPGTFSERFCIEEAGLIPRTERNIRLLWFLFRTWVMWLKARKVRAEFERCRESGEPFYVDKFGPPGRSR